MIVRVYFHRLKNKTSYINKDTLKFIDISGVESCHVVEGSITYYLAFIISNLI